MPKKVTIVDHEGRLTMVQGGRKKAARTGGTPIVVLRGARSKPAWWRPGRHWWSLPMWCVFQRTKHGVIVRQPCILDVLGKA